MAQKRVPPAHGTAQGKHTKSDGASSQSTTSSSEYSTNVDGLKAHTHKFQEAIAMVQESIKPFSPPFRRKAAALIDQVAELVKQLNQVAIDEELYGNASLDVEVDTQPSVVSSSDDYISNPELTDSESNTDNTSVSSIPRQLIVENETPAFAEDDQHGPIHPPCAQCGVKTLYFCTRQDKKTKKPCRYAHHVLAEWKRHMKTQKHSQRERFMCTECPNSPPAIDINGHSVCQFCEGSFPTLGANLRAHYTQCQSAQRANKSYGRQDKLIDHLRSHPGVINLSLTAATGRYTVNSEWPDECGFCGKIFSSFDEMLDDIAKHFQAGLNMSSWKFRFQPSKDSHPGFQPHSKGDDSDSDDDMDDNDSYPSHQSSGGQTKEASSFSRSSQSKRSNGNQKSGSSYQDGRRRCYLVPQATPDNSAEPIGSHASGHATISVALERYLNDKKEPIELRLSETSSDISKSSPMFSAAAIEDDLVSNVPDLEYVMHSLALHEHRGCFKETIPSTGLLQVPFIGSSGFGFGIGDFFALGQLALDVYKSCKTASEDLKNLSSEILSLLEILQALRTLQSDHSLPEWNQGTLANLLSTCRDVLQDVQAQVEKRKSFKSDRKRMLLFDRLKWGKYDIDVLTTRLTRNRAIFAIFLMAAESALTLAKLRQNICQGACMSNDGTGRYGITNHISEVFTGNGNETHPGLIVTDGAVIPTALGVNLFATINVLAERSVKYTAKCRIFQNIDIEPNDVLDIFGSPYQVNSDNQVLHRRGTYRTSEAKDLIRATRAASSNGSSLSEAMSGYIHVSSCLEVDKIEDYRTAAETARGLCEEARFFFSMKAWSLQVGKEFCPSSKDSNLEKSALKDEVISQGVPLQPTRILKVDPKYQWLASRISHQQANKYKNLLDIHVKHSEALHWGSLDLIQGKGTGLFILLHGVPGIGKTAIAEAIAQANGKPLFKTTIGDLGMIPERLEISLREKFHLANIWDCVFLVLLDEAEADTFFAQQSQADMAINENALVSSEFSEKNTLV
ncbi:hypothetical protein N431DRAFT_76822 [Stipitochalara longipes BDJ]|nr:hypothetical protein N431DRAFT_76822 [Stipitochalara longipes BDJ]